MLPNELDESLDKILNETPAWSVPMETNRCEVAQDFYEWTQENMNEEVLSQAVTRLSIIVAKSELSDRYQELRKQVNKRCRNHISDRGHKCIFHVWDQAYQKLLKLEGQLPMTVTFPELQQLKELKERDEEQPWGTLAAFEIEE